MAKRINIDDIIGNTYNYLTVLSEGEPYILEGGYRHRSVFAECSCGTIKRYDMSSVISGNAKSCGCWGRKAASDRLKIRMTKHGMKRTSEYNSWVSMKMRCLNPKNPSYKNYGGRGIKICDEWINSFEKFYADMGSKPTPQHSIDRIDVNGGYCFSNCKWSTAKEQSVNKRNSISVSIGGVTKPIEQWAKEIGISRVGLEWRIRKNYSESEMLKKPQKRHTA